LNSVKFGAVRFLAAEDRECFRAQVTQLVETFEIFDSRRDVPMKEFLKWRMRCLWFLYRYLGGGHPYYSEFLGTLEREADPHSNGRLVLAGQAILEALLADFEAGFLFLEEDSG
jgi:hypothetical protein